MEENRPFYELPLGYPVEDQPQPDVLRDIVYTGQDDTSPRLDIYRPSSAPPQSGFPLLILLHGGPQLPGPGRPWPKDWRVFQDYGRLAAANGMAAAIPNHRYTGYDTLSLALEDTQTAVRFLLQERAQYDLDGDRLAIWAFSGAGMLLSPYLSGELPGLRAVAAFYPMLDLTHIEQATAAHSEQQLIALSPLSQIETIPPSLPILLARAGLDRPGLNRALDTFVKQALYHNLNLEVHNLPQAGHGFDFFEADSTAVRETIKRGIDFLVGQLA
ncbi:MAG: alpha/beta hydrolase [Chloroflexota bacterium]